ncbi:MAG: DUF748 domain-containing protein [Nitrospinae bacterium]|nr:DUF748 domain-containing protein [Nitrospinota bacterium]
MARGGRDPGFDLADTVIIRTPSRRRPFPLVKALLAMLGLTLASAAALFFLRGPLVAFIAQRAFCHATGHSMTLNGLSFTFSRAGVGSLSVSDGKGERWLTVDGFQAEAPGLLQTGHYQVDSVKLGALDLRVTRDESGEINLQKFADGLKGDPAAPVELRGDPGFIASLAAPFVRKEARIGELSLDSGRVSFTDYKVSSRGYSIALERIYLRALPLATPGLDMPMSFTASGKLGGEGLREGSWEAAGDGIAPRPERMSFHVTFNARDVDVRIANPYLASGGNCLQGGAAHGRGDVRAKDSRLSGWVKLSLKGLDISPAEGCQGLSLLGLTKKGALALLTAKGGDVKVGVVVKGTLQKPEFLLDDQTVQVIAARVGRRMLIGAGYLFDIRAGAALTVLEFIENDDEPESANAAPSPHKTTIVEKMQGA